MRARWVWAVCFAGLIVARLVVLADVLASVPPDPAGHYVASDALRYTDIGRSPGRPWRDRPVEYTPLEVAELSMTAGDDPRETAVRSAWVQVALDLAVAGAVALGWGPAAALAYLALGLPLAPFLAFRLDLLSVALATAGMALVVRRRDGAGGAVLGLAVFAKLWPVVLAVVLVANRRWRAAAWMGGVVVAGSLAWVAYAGTEGPAQVLTFRGASGWQIESVVGALLLAVTAAPVIYEQGANRIGRAAGWMRGGLTAGLAAWLGAVGWLGRAGRASRAAGAPRGTRTTGERIAVASLAAVAGLLVFAPILSWQYVGWLLPWCAVAIAGRRWVLATAAVAVVGLTAVLVFQGVPLTARSGSAIAVLLARNLALLLLAGTTLATLARRPRDGRLAP